MYEVNRPMTKEERIEQAIQYLEGMKTDIARMDAFKLQDMAIKLKGFHVEAHSAMHHAGFAMEIIGDAIEVLKDVQARNRVDQEKTPD